MSNTKVTIVTMGGLEIVPDIEIDKFSMDDAAALILPGGNTWTDQIHNLVLSIAEKCLNNGTIVAAICGATIGLARVGLLNQKYHTSNDLAFLKMICPNYKVDEGYAITDKVSSKIKVDKKWQPFLVVCCSFAFSIIIGIACMYIMNIPTNLFFIFSSLIMGIGVGFANKLQNKNK